MKNSAPFQNSVSNLQCLNQISSSCLRGPWFFHLILVIGGLTFCSGCAVTGIIGAVTTSHFSGSEELEYDSTIRDVMAIVEHAGKSLGYRVIMRRKRGEFNIVGFQRNTPFPVDLAVDYFRNASIMVMQKSGKYTCCYKLEPGDFPYP